MKCVLNNDVVAKQLLTPQDVDMPEGIFPVSVACGPKFVLVLARDRTDQGVVLTAGEYGRGQKLTVCAWLRTKTMVSRSWSPSQDPRPPKIRTFKHPRKHGKKTNNAATYK
jgi:hypothetical protein